VEPTDNVPTLPATTVHDLRMIARESITNALKHGRATNVRITLNKQHGELVMRIVDNGCGFDVTAAATQKRGHFGCAGIRERARKIGAQVTWESARDHGTTVEVRLPLSTGSPSTINPPLCPTPTHR
jgi:signal transduction histidine kinase